MGHVEMFMNLQMFVFLDAGCYPKCPKDKPIFDEQNQVCVKECIPTCYVNGIEYKPQENIPTDKSCHEWYGP